MKKFTLLFLSLLTASYAMADRVTTKQAQQNVMTFVAHEHPVYGRSVQKPYDKVYESEGYFVFAGKANKGFVIAAADDQMVSEVLGYTDEGNFDASNMPDAMKELLQNYDKEAKWLSQHPEAKMKKTHASRAAIAPLITTHWKQDPFYNDQCPMYGKERCVTGCVATAAAQVMYFHKWPETGTGTHSYQWSTQTLSRDFSQSTYDWNSMTIRLDSTSTQKAKDAVAKLMSDIGIAIDMNYGESSGTKADSLAYALPLFFKYSKEAYIAYRTYYTTDEWEQLAYESLQRREPICYGSRGSDGHEFVCDGYKDGYFHINWGWDDGKDGYFLLSALNTEGIAETGGNNPLVGDQTMILNLRPDKENNTKFSAHIVNDIDFNVKFDQKANQYSMNGCFLTHQPGCPSVNMGMEFVDSVSGKSEFHYCKEQRKFAFFNDLVFTLNVPNDIFPTKDGVYKVYPAFYDIDTKTNNRIRTKAMLKGSQTITIKDGKVTIGDSNATDPYLGCKNVTYGKFYAGKFSQVKATIYNKSKERYSDDIQFCLGSTNTTYSFVDLEPGDSTVLIVTLKAPEEANKGYIFKITDNLLNNLKFVSDVMVYAVPTGKFAGKLTSEPKITIDEDFNVTAVADYACTSGFCDDIALTFYETKNDNDAGQFDMQLPMGTGDSGTMTIKAKFDKLKPGTEYLVTIAAHIGDKYTNLMYGSKEKFTVKTPGTTGIDDVEEDVNDNNNDNTIYDLQGRKVINPRHGQIYIINGKKVLK